MQKSRTLTAASGSENFQIFVTSVETNHYHQVNFQTSQLTLYIIYNNIVYQSKSNTSIYCFRVRMLNIFYNHTVEYKIAEKISKRDSH